MSEPLYGNPTLELSPAQNAADNVVRGKTWGIVFAVSHRRMGKARASLVSIVGIALSASGGHLAAAQGDPGPVAPPAPTAAPVDSATPPPAPAPPARALTHSLHGVVRDAKSKAPVVGAVITAPSGASAITEGDGTFVIAVTDDDTLLVDAEGFDQVAITSALEGTTDHPLIVTLTSLATVGGEVVEVKARPPTPVSGGVTLSRTELATIPGTGGDLLAGLTVMPGVSIPQGRGGGQGIVIRGSAPQDSRFLLDGFDIPQLYHLFNRSIIPTQAVANLQFQPGAFDVKYGRASSGIIAITSRGGNDKLEAVTEISIIDAYAVASGPISKKLRMLASFRRSYVDTWLPSVLPKEVGLVAAPRFYDGLLRFDYDPTSRWHTALTIIGSDDLTKLISNDKQTDKEFAFSADTGFLRGIASGYWRGPNKLTLDLGASVLTQAVSFTAGDQFLKSTLFSISARGELTKELATFAGLRDVVFRTGVEIDPKRAKLALELIQSDSRSQQGFMMDQSPRNSFNGTFWLPDFGAWANMEAGLSPTLRFSTGVRVDEFVRNRAYEVQPRGDLTWRPTSTFKLRFAAGRYTRPPEFRDELLNVKLGPESATQLALGGEKKIGSGGNVQLTFYDTERTGLIFRNAQTGQYANQGRGRTIGAEVLSTYQNKQWFAWLAYSLSKSTRRSTAAGPNYPFDFDQTHDLVVATTYKTRDGRWQFGGRFNYSTGKPATPIIGAVFDSDGDRYIPINGEINSTRVRAAHQLDLRVDRIWKFKTWALSAFLDINNAYMNPAVIQYQYNFDFTQRASIENIPILPSIGIKGEL